MFQSREEAISRLTEAFLSGNINRGMVNEAEANAEKIKIQQAEERRIGKERHCREQEIKNRPENGGFVRAWNRRIENPLDLAEYLEKQDLKSLEDYANNWMGGAGSEFSNNSAFEAYACLKTAIQRRKSI